MRAFCVLHASVLTTWGTSQPAENKYSVPRHASLPVAPSQHHAAPRKHPPALRPAA